MSKYRKIDPRIWNDEHFRNLSDSAKLLFIFLLTHPHMTALGAMRATEPGLQAELNWNQKAFAKAFAELFRKPFVKVDSEASFLWIPKFINYNQPENPNVLKSWESALDYIPECVLKYKLMEDVKAFAEGLGEAFAKALPKAFAKGARKPLPNHEQEPEQEQEQEQNTIMQLEQSIKQIEEEWNKAPGIQPIKKIKGARYSHLKARIKENDWPWQDALKKFPLKCFIRDNGWKPNFDWFIKPDTVNNILEGKYDWDPNKPQDNPPIALGEPDTHEGLLTEEEKEKLRRDYAKEPQ